MDLLPLILVYALLRLMYTEYFVVRTLRQTLQSLKNQVDQEAIKTETIANVKLDIETIARLTKDGEKISQDLLKATEQAHSLTSQLEGFVAHGDKVISRLYELMLPSTNNRP